MSKKRKLSATGDCKSKKRILSVGGDCDGMGGAFFALDEILGIKTLEF